MGGFEMIGLSLEDAEVSTQGGAWSEAYGF